MRKTLVPMREAELSRLLCGLERELIEATDEEIVQAAEDLGMDVRMKGSAAFLGLIYSMPKRIEDIFDVEELRDTYAKFLGMQGLLLPPGKKDGDVES